MKYVPIILMLLTVSVAQAEIFDGVYEQQLRETNFSDSKKALRYKEVQEKNKITLIVQGGELTVSMFNGEDAATLPITEYGKTFVATDEDMYWVVYQKDKSNLYSSGVHFVRVGDASP